MGPLDNEEFDRVAEVVLVRPHHGRRGLDLQLVRQALLSSAGSRLDPREMVGHRDRFAIDVARGVHHLIRDSGVS